MPDSETSRTEAPPMAATTAPPIAPTPPAASTRPLAPVWHDRAFSAFCLLSIGYLFVHILLYAYGRDQGIYATVASTILRGGMPYRDAWDFKPPGIFLVYALTRLVLGPAQVSIRVVEVLGLASVVYAFALLSCRFFGDARVGLAGGALAVLVHAQLEFWHTAQPESFGGMLVAWALVLATFEPRDPHEPGSSGRRDRLRQVAAWVGAGALYGFAGLLKPPLAGGAAVSAVFAALRIHRQRAPWLGGWSQALRAWLAPAVCMAVGGAAVVGSCALWFVARGAWADLHETLFVFTPYYTRLSWQDATIPGMVYLAVEEWAVDLSSANFVGMVAAALLVPLASREREGILHVLGVVAVQLVGVAMQGKFSLPLRLLPLARRAARRPGRPQALAPRERQGRARHGGLRSHGNRRSEVPDGAAQSGNGLLLPVHRSADISAFRSLQGEPRRAQCAPLRGRRRVLRRRPPGGRASSHAPRAGRLGIHLGLRANDL